MSQMSRVNEARVSCAESPRNGEDIGELEREASQWVARSPRGCS